MLRIKVEQNSICKNKMPPKKDTSKSSTTETSEDEISCREQLETLQLQLEEARAVAREAQERVLTAKEDRQRILERARENEATAEDDREKVMELQQKLAELQAPGEVYSRQCQTFWHCSRMSTETNCRKVGKLGRTRSSSLGSVQSDLYIIRIGRQSVLEGISVYLPMCICEVKTKFLTLEQK